METVTRNVRDLDHSERSVMERFVGHQLEESQQITVNVVNAGLNIPELVDEEASPHPLLPDWCNIYEDLTDEEVDDIHESITRCTLTRSFE